MDTDDISGLAQVPDAIKMIMDSVFLLYIRPFRLDLNGQVAEAVATNLCFEAEKRRRHG